MGNGAPKVLDTVVMSGGAPVSPLMAGFLYALWNEGKTFKTFHTSGAGALMALLSIAPKKGSPGEALENWVESGVADEIYDHLPTNFKLFRKPGPATPVMHRLAERFKLPLTAASAQQLQHDIAKQLENDPIRWLRNRWLARWLDTDDSRRLYNDTIELFFSALTPSTLTYKSKGMAAPVPFLDEIVDFEKLRGHFGRTPELKGGHLCVNAYNMTKRARDARNGGGTPQAVAGAAQGSGGAPRIRVSAIQASARIKTMRDQYKEMKTNNDQVMEIFDTDRHEIDGQHIRAAFSMPFIYPPTEIDGSHYSEGADHEPVNFRHIEQEQQKYDPLSGESGEVDEKSRKEASTVVLLDVLACLEDYLVRTPRDLWDAYVISIMTPVVALARFGIAEFKEDQEVRYKAGKGWVRLYGHALHGDREPPQGESPVDWDIPDDAQPYVMDWSYSNLRILFDVGRKTGERFYEEATENGWAFIAHPDALKK